MFSAFLMGPAASGSGLCDIDRVMFRVITSHVEKIGKSWDGENITIIIRIENAILSVYFCHARTTQFSDT